MDAVGVTHLTKLPASMCLKPAELNRSISSILVCVGTMAFSFCRPSLAPTSTIFTTLLLGKGWSIVISASVEYLLVWELRGEGMCLA